MDTPFKRKAKNKRFGQQLRKHAAGAYMLIENTVFLIKKKKFCTSKKYSVLSLKATDLIFFFFNVSYSYFNNVFFFMLSFLTF